MAFNMPILTQLTAAEMYYVKYF